jgi:uncharacterized membrane protein
MKDLPSSHIGPLVSSATLLGIGLGGFLDGIVLHQILQWHHMLSARLPPVDLVNVKVNMFWDGLFHAFTWGATFVGLLLLWRTGGLVEVPRSSRVFGGSLALGWGIFNLVEGIVDHQLLGIHHVHPGAGQLAWDIGFLLSGAALILGGWMTIRSHRAVTRRGRAPAHA